MFSWTRGTGLMSATNIVAHKLEGYGVRTFSAKEMAFSLSLMHPLLFSITQVEPIWADLNGGMDRLPDLADITSKIRVNLNKKSELYRAIAGDTKLLMGSMRNGGHKRLMSFHAPTSASNSLPWSLSSLSKTFLNSEG